MNAWGTWAADAVALAHLAWIAFFVAGPLLLRRRAVRAAHLAVVWLTAGLWRFYCPLTVFENVLRSRYDPAGASPEGFLVRCFRPIADLTEWGRPLAVGVLLWAAGWSLVYGALWARERPRRPGV